MVASPRGESVLKRGLHLGLALLAFAVLPASAHAAYPGANGKIAFVGQGGIETIAPDGTGHATLVPRTEPALQVCGADFHDPNWSPDGQRLAFQCYTSEWVVNADGSGLARIGTGDMRQADWSPDGQRIVFARYTGSCNALWTANADGTNETEIVPVAAAACRKPAPAWSPNGDLIAFHSGFSASVYTVRPDGSDLRGPITTGADVDWSPAGHRLLLEDGGDLYSASPDGSHRVRLSGGGFSPGYAFPAWSPDGTTLVFDHGKSILRANDAGTGVAEIYADPVLTTHWADWQPLPPLPPPDPGYARPHGATPLSVSLVPAYRACASPNDAHGPPLAFGSCRPPQQVSDGLTVGTPDANGSGANAIGRVELKTVVGDPANSVDDADVRVEATVTDVRCRLDLPGYCAGGAGSDYLFDLAVAPTVRITDRYSGGAARDPATMTDWIQLSARVPCSPTPASDAIGSACGVSTTMDAVAPGTVPEGRRSVWELDQVVVRDGGIDDPQVEYQAPFLVQGLFVP